MSRSRFGQRYTVRAAAFYLGVSVSKLRTLIRRSRIQARRDSARGHFFFYESDLVAYLESTPASPVVIDMPSTVSTPPPAPRLDVSHLPGAGHFA